MPEQMRQDAIMAELSLMPGPDDWEGLPGHERKRRAAEAWAATMRMIADGPCRAEPSAERGRQFMPFAALKVDYSGVEPSGAPEG